MTKIAQMVNSLIRLKIATYLNAGDHEFSKASNRQILYFIDADILGLFIESPRRKLNAKAISRSGHTNLNLFDSNEEVPVYVPAEYETAEYIFSWYLPAQGKSPLYICDLHQGEVERIRLAITSLPRDPNAPHYNILDEEAWREIKNLSAEIIRSADDGYSEREIMELCHKAARFTVTLLEPPHETNQPDTYRSAQTELAMARARKRWSSGRNLREYVRAADERSAKAVLDWCAYIASERDGVGFESPERGLQIYRECSNWEKDRILSDACALAELIELNRQLPPHRKAVLISGTHSVHRAYARWYRSREWNKPPGRPRDSYLLRHPIQYLPLINWGNYSDALKLNFDRERTGKSFKDIISSLDVFLDPLRSRPDFLEVLRLFYELDDGHNRATESKLRAELKWFVTDALNEPVRRWRLAYGNSILIGLPAIERRRREHDDILRDAIQQAGGDLLAAQNYIVANLQKDHVASFLAALAAKVREEREGGKEGGQKRGAPPARVRPVVLPLIELRPELRECLKRAYEGPIEHAIREVREMSGDETSPARTAEDLVASIILVLSLGAWALAKRLAGDYLTHEGESEPPLPADAADPLSQEFRYLYALAVRFDCADISEYRRAFAFLSGQMEGAASIEALRHARALIERGTLQLAAALHVMTVSRTRKAMTWPDFRDDSELGEASQLLAGAANDLRGAFELLSRADPGEAGDLAETRDRLLLQAAVNSLSQTAMQHLAGVPLSDADRELAEAAANTVRPFYESRERLHPIAMLNYEAYRKIADPKAPFPGEGGREIMDLCASAAADDSFSRRVIAPSDIDLAQLYQGLVSEGR